LYFQTSGLATEVDMNIGSCSRQPYDVEFYLNMDEETGNDNTA